MDFGVLPSFIPLFLPPSLALCNTHPNVQPRMIYLYTVCQKTVRMIGGFSLFREYLHKYQVYAHIKNTYRKVCFIASRRYIICSVYCSNCGEIKHFLKCTHPDSFFAERPELKISITTHLHAMKKIMHVLVHYKNTLQKFRVSWMRYAIMVE